MQNKCFSNLASIIWWLYVGAFKSSDGSQREWWHRITHHAYRRNTLCGR